MLRRFGGLGIALAAAAALGSGCSDDVGNVTVSYTIGIAGTCADSNLATVRLIIEDEDGEVASGQAPCMDSGEVSVKDVVVGSYFGVLEGVTADGIVTHRVRDISIRVTAGQTATGVARLVPIPATLRLAWSFPDARMCNHPLVMVDTILVEAFDENDSPVTFPRGTDQAACTDAFVSLESDDFEQGNYDVLVTGLRGSMRAFQQLIENVPLQPGTVTDRTAMLKPCEEQTGGACR